MRQNSSDESSMQTDTQVELCPSCGGSGLKRDVVLLMDKPCVECPTETEQENGENFNHFSYLP